jgi:tetratricopeptide (TPR) repeat protein
MPSIGNYIISVQVLLVEFGKYFALLLLSVLAFRIWRSSLKMPAASRPRSMLLAGFITFLAIGTGYFSIQNSMGMMYFHYGEQAFNSGRLAQAYSLFDYSAKFWDGADVTGRKGVCVLLLGNTDQGEALLEKAKVMRHGNNNSFEQYYEGLYYLIHNQEKKAIPLLAAVSADPLYHWIVIKYFAALDLDAGHPQDAAELMKPYMQAAVTEGDQAYIVAALKLAAGKPDEAKALLDKFSSSELPPFWKSRFEKLQSQVKKN